MKFQDSSFNGLKVTVGTKSVTHPRMHARTHARSKSNMPHQLFQSWGHNHIFSSEIIVFTAVKNCSLFHRRVMVMCSPSILRQKVSLELREETHTRKQIIKNIFNKTYYKQSVEL